MMIWMQLIKGMITTSGSGPPGAEDRGETDLPADILSYFFMVWISLILGGVLLIEQYFGRRIFCFNPESFNEPPHAIAEYCWRHGNFLRNGTQPESSIDSSDFESRINIPDTNWLLQVYVYFFIRAFVFFLPHAAWNSKYRQWVSAIIAGTEDVLKELKTIWLKYADVVDKAYRDYERMNDESPRRKSSSSSSDDAALIRATHLAVMAVTRDVVQITKHQIPRYKKLLTFVEFRTFFSFIFISLFVIFDLVLFVNVNRYDSTDYYCNLPNKETIRCMVPAMQFLWHASLLGALCSIFVFAVRFMHTISMIIMLCSTSTAGCFLERVPLSGMAADLAWSTSTDRRIYKLASKFLLQNILILHPLNFLEAFVNHLIESNKCVKSQVHGEKYKELVVGFSDMMENESGTLLRETEGL